MIRLQLSIGEERITIEDAYEPYLIQAGFLHRTQKGRMVSEKAYRHLGLTDDRKETAKSEEYEREEQIGCLDIQ